MDKLENTLRLLKHDSPERIGCYEHFWGETIPEWVKQGYPLNDDGTPKNINEVFDYDMFSCGRWIHGYPKLEDERIEETDEWFIVKNGAGATMRFMKNASSTPEHLGFDIDCEEKWLEYKPYYQGFNKGRIFEDSIKKDLEYCKKLGCVSLLSNVSVFETLRSHVGDVNMCINLIEEPEWIEDLCDTFTDMLITHYDWTFKNVMKPDAMWIYEDMGYNKGLLCSPRTMKAHIYPYHKKLVDYFKSQGLETFIHSCGNITLAIPDIIDSGFACLNPMEVKAGCDVLEFAKEYGDKLAFCGGMDVRIMETNDKDIIKKEMDRLFGEMKKIDAMWFFASDHSIPPRVNYDTYRYIMDYYYEHREY